MKLRAALAAALLVSAGGSPGCGGGKALPPLAQPESGAPRETVAPAPPQTVLPAPPPEKKLEPLPTAARRVLVCVTERVGSAETARRDAESEAIIAEALLAASGDLGLEVVKKGTHDEIIERDIESLVLRGFDENSRMFSNLLRTGVDLLAVGEVGASELGREVAGGKVLVDRHVVHAGIQLVRTDTATVLAAGNADTEETSLREAKSQALRQASARMVEALRGAGKGPAPLSVMITVEGLREFAQAERIARRIRETEGILWSRDLRWSAGAPGTAAGTARYELAWTGTPEGLRERIAALDAGVRLEATRVDGGRWNYRAVETSPAAPAAEPK